MRGYGSHVFQHLRRCEVFRGIVPVRDGLGATIIEARPITPRFTVATLTPNGASSSCWIGRADDRLMLCNGLLLLGMTIVPFPTELVAEYLRHDGQRMLRPCRTARSSLPEICYNLLWRTAAVNDRLFHAHASRQAAQRIFDSDRYGPPLVRDRIHLAFVSVTASLVVNLVLAIFFARLTAAAESSDQPVVI